MSQLTTQFGRFQLQEIFAQLSSALLLTDVDGVLQDWNERAATLLDGVLEKGEVLYGLMTDEMERGRVHKQAGRPCRARRTAAPPQDDPALCRWHRTSLQCRPPCPQEAQTTHGPAVAAGACCRDRP